MTPNYLMPYKHLGSLGIRRGGEILYRLEGRNRPLVVEVGVWEGDLAEFLLSSRPDLSMILVDPWREAVAGSNYKASGDSKANVGQERMDKAKEVTRDRLKPYSSRYVIFGHKGSYAAASIGALLSTRTQGRIDLVFLDADHSYDGTMEELQAWWSVLEDGFLGAHDYGPEGWGVKQAFDDFARQTDRKVMIGEDKSAWLKK